MGRACEALGRRGKGRCARDTGRTRAEGLSPTWVPRQRGYNGGGNKTNNAPRSLIAHHPTHSLVPTPIVAAFFEAAGVKKRPQHMPLA